MPHNNIQNTEKQSPNHPATLPHHRTQTPRRHLNPPAPHTPQTTPQGHVITAGKTLKRQPEPIHNQSERSLVHPGTCKNISVPRKANHLSTEKRLIVEVELLQ